jgi:hypothetical protein
VPELYDMPERYSRISPLTDPAARETASEAEKTVALMRVSESVTLTGPALANLLTEYDLLRAQVAELEEAKSDAYGDGWNDGYEAGVDSERP